jgi:hypothetical protein
MGGVHVLHRGGGVDSDETDEVNGIGGVWGLVQDAVAAELLGDQADLVEGGSQPAVAQGRLGRVPRGVAGDEAEWLVMNRCGLVVSMFPLVEGVSVGHRKSACRVAIA